MGFCAIPDLPDGAAALVAVTFFGGDVDFLTDFDAAGFTSTGFVSVNVDGFCAGSLAATVLSAVAAVAAVAVATVPDEVAAVIPGANAPLPRDGQSPTFEKSLAYKRNIHIF